MLQSGLREASELVSSELAGLLKGEPEELYKLMSDYPLRGGKSIRPFLCLQGAEVVGGERKDAMPFALAAELLHNFSLVHDDIEDGSRTRRGEPCLHLLHGEPLAINAGDGLFSLAFEALHSSSLPTDVVCEASSLLAATATTMCEGQALDIQWQKEKHFPSEKEYLNMIYKKTGVLIATSLELGAIAGGGKAEEREILREFGSSLGIAFQIQDDLLDLTGDEKVVGKSLGNDVVTGKRTLVAIHAMEKANPRDMKRMREILDSRENSRKETDECIKLFREYGAIDHAKKTASSLVHESEKRVDALPPSDAKKTLLELAEFVVKREF